MFVIKHVCHLNRIETYEYNQNSTTVNPNAETRVFLNHVLIKKKKKTFNTVQCILKCSLFIGEEIYFFFFSHFMVSREN
jgi:hypothetical protein